MATSQVEKILFSKSQLRLELAAVICFMVAGIWLLLDPPVISHNYLGSTTSLSITGLLTLFYFGLVMLILVKRLRDDKSALTIDNNGIVDNASTASAGFISWSDIQDIRFA